MVDRLWTKIFPPQIVVQVTAADIARGGNPVYWALKRTLRWTHRLEVNETIWRTSGRQWRELPYEVIQALRTGNLPPEKFVLVLDLVTSGYIGWEGG